ncbi:MAG: recombination protein F [Erythrobacter sp.]
MYAPIDISKRVFAAISALAITAVFLATAIVPATPSLGVLA